MYDWVWDVVGSLVEKQIEEDLQWLEKRIGNYLEMGTEVG